MSSFSPLQPPNITYSGLKPLFMASLNELTGNVNLTSPANTITIVKNGQDIQLEAVAVVPLEGVDSLNGLTGDLEITSTDGSIIITEPTPNKINLQAATSPASPILAGIFTATTAGITTVTISAPGVTAASVVVATFIHPATGGQNQYIQIITPSTDTITVHVASNFNVGDQINWIAYN